MAKWFGVIGYAGVFETSPGVYCDDVIERNYTGDVIRNSSRWSASSESTNDDLDINNQFSILADPFAYQNFHSMKYIEYMGTKWKIATVEVQFPRLILNVGGKYNG